MIGHADDSEDYRSARTNFTRRQTDQTQRAHMNYDARTESPSVFSVAPPTQCWWPNGYGGALPMPTQAVPQGRQHYYPNQTPHQYPYPCPFPFYPPAAAPVSSHHGCCTCTGSVRPVMRPARPRPWEGRPVKIEFGRKAQDYIEGDPLPTSPPKHNNNHYQAEFEEMLRILKY